MLSYLNQNVCRCCLMEQPWLSYNLHENNLARDLCELVPGLQITPQDGLSEIICELCVRRMREALEFRRCCNETEHILRQRHEQVWQAWKEATPTFDDVMECFEREVNTLEQINMQQVCHTGTQIELETNTAKINKELDLVPTTATDCDFNTLDFNELLPQPEDIDVCMLASPCESSIELDELVARIYNEQVDIPNTNLDPTPAAAQVVTDKPVAPLPQKPRGGGKKMNALKSRHPCSECEKKFTRNFQLKLHLISVHGKGDGLRYRCDECQKTFASRHSLFYHCKSIHSAERPFECEHCQRRFVLRTQLVSHLRVHSGQPKPRIFECTKCGKTWPTRSGLRTHMRTHDPALDRPFKCDRCEKAFFTRGHLQSHILVHTGEKPFACSYCEKSYQCVGNLNNHVARHHANVLANDVVLEC